MVAEQRDGYSVSLRKIVVSGGEKVDAYLLVPEGERPKDGFPAVLVLHDHGAHFSIGKEKLVRPVADCSRDSATHAAVLADAEAWVKKYYDGAFVADSLARDGYVVLCIDALYWGSRAISQPEWTQGEAAVKQYNRALRDYQKTFYSDYFEKTKQPWFERILADDKACVDYLVSLPEVDASRIACFGFSMGAYRAWQLAAEDKRVSVCVAANWMTTMVENGGPLPNVSAWSMYRPDGYPDNDYPVVASRIAPRPFLLMYGEEDALFTEEGVNEAIAVIKEAYKADETAFSPRSFPYKHFFSSEHLSALREWLKTFL